MGFSRSVDAGDALSRALGATIPNRTLWISNASPLDELLR